MTYEQLKNLKSKDFKRLCGVHPGTFTRMVEVLQPDLERAGKRGGQPKLGVEDQLGSDMEVVVRLKSLSALHCSHE